MADDIVVDVSFRGNGSEFLAELSRAVGRAKSQLQEMGQATAGLSRLETQLARMAGAANQSASASAKAAASMQGWSQKWTPFKGQFQEAEANSKGLWKSIDTGIASAEGSLARATKAVQQFDESQRVAAQKRVAGNPMADWDKEFQALSKAADDNAAQMRKAKAAQEEFRNSLSNSRYVLYDVAGTLATIGAAFVLPLTGAVGVAVQFEKEFAQVERTSGATGDALLDLKYDFDQLYGSIPITYSALADIATLAGQLGIPTGQIAQFTESVAQTAAVTDLSVEQAATAFGRLNALIPNVKGQYDRLGSAIALVGVNSVATESEIVNISTQISSMGSFAGLTAQDIIGLSGALASIGAQPELSRGTVTRVFTLMSKAVAEGGDRLDEFARVSGVSSSQFAETWGTPAFTQTFLGFMAGIRDEGGSAVQTLNDLGITSVRDVPLLLRLANAADSTGQAGKLLAQTIGDSNKGWAENTELQRQYEIIAGTVAAKLQVLANNFNLLLAAVGGPLLTVFGEFISFLTDASQELTNFAKTDFGKNLLGGVAILTALIGVLALAGAGMALLGASIIGINQGLAIFRGLAAQATAQTVGLGTASAGASAGLFSAGAGAKVFAAGVGLLKAGLAGLALGGVVLGIQAMSDAFTNANYESKGMGKGLDETFERIKSNAKATADAFVDSSTAWLGQGARDFGVATNRQTAGLSTNLEVKDVARLDEQLSALARNGGAVEARQKVDELRNAFGTAGVSSSDFNTLFRDTIGALGEGGAAAQEAGVGVEELGDVEAQAAAATEQLAASLGLTEEALKSFVDGFSGGTAAFFDFKSMLEEAYGENGGGLAQFTESLRNQLVDVQAWQDGIAVLMARGATSAAQEFAKLGPSSAQAVADARNLTDPELAALNADIAQVGTLSSQEFATNFISNTPLLQDAYKVGGDAAVKSLSDALMKGPDSARAALDEIIRVAKEKEIPIKAISDFAQAYDDLASLTKTRTMTIWAMVQTKGLGGVDVNQPPPGIALRKASGGSIWGPGTGTSDSILARLSNGEFVVRAQAASAIGHGRLDYMNRTGKLPAFATGGSVGTPSGGGMGGTVMVELSPTDRMLLARAGDVSLNIDSREIANAANGANLVSARRGSN